MSVLTIAGAGQYTFERGYPTAETAERARDDADYARALIAYHFWYPTVSMEAVFSGPREAGIRDNRDIAFGAATARWVTFTANSDTPYGLACADVKDRPIVIEIPPGPIVGFVDDHHQRSVVDLGLSGPDQDRGGKFLLVSPEYRDEPPPGYHVVRSSAYKHWIVFRAIPRHGNVDEAKQKLQSVKIYALGSPGNPMAFVDITNTDIPHGNLVAWEDNIQYWQKLHEVLDYEPVVNDMLPMYGLLMQLGIVKGRPFEPDARMKALLERAAREGKAQMLVSCFDSVRPDRIAWQDRRWEWAALVSGNGYFQTPFGLDLEARDRWFAQAVGTSPVLFNRAPGAGSLYWQAVRDKDGNWLDGANTYKLTVPLPVPARLFWSVTLHDNDTRSEIVNTQGKSALRSLFELRDAMDRQSVDLYFGPKPPKAGQTYWIQTVPGKGWFAWFRVYGPQPGVFDGSWRPGDFERMD